MSCDLVALAVSLDGNGIKFGLGDNGNLGVEVDAEEKYYLVTFRKGDKVVDNIFCTYSPVITTSGD